MKKASVKKKNGLMDDINQLHDCIESDQNQLAKLFNQAIAGVSKRVTTTVKMLEKAKKAVVKAKSKKKESPKTYQVSFTQAQSLKKELAHLKAEQASVVAGHKKFTAQQKVQQQFEKQWSKKLAPKKPKNVLRLLLPNKPQ